MSESDEESEQLQVILLGDGSVGKTSIAMRFTEDYFGKSYKQTVGLDFFVRKVTLPSEIDVTIQVWDIGGQTLGGKMINKYVYGAQAIVLIYDISNYQSFENLQDWYALVKKTFNGRLMPYVALMANKADLSHIRAVTPEMHNEFADANEMCSYFVSAKTGDNVTTTFYRVAADLAGIDLSNQEIEVVRKIVRAEIVNNPTSHVARRKAEAKKTSSKCIIM